MFQVFLNEVHFVILAARRGSFRIFAIGKSPAPTRLIEPFAGGAIVSLTAAFERLDTWHADRAVPWLKLVALTLHDLAPGIYKYHRQTRQPPQTV